VNLGELSVVVSYDISVRQFVIYSEDMDLLTQGSFTYTVTGHLTLYPDCATCTAETTGTIVILNPCNSAMFYPGQGVDIVGGYTASLTFVFPQLTVSPPVCVNYAVYTCQYINGPYYGMINMCGFNSGNCYANFDSTTGGYTFFCDDMDLMPPGEYKFRVKVEIGTRKRNVNFSMIICDDSEPVIITNPFVINSEDIYYTIGNGPMTIPFDNSQIGNIQASGVCGTPSIQIVTSTGLTQLWYWITIDYDLSIIIINCDDIDVSGSYTFVFYYFSSISVTNFSVSTEFIITIINVCIPPPNCITIIGCGIPPPTVLPPTIDIDISVTVNVDISVTLPPWSCGTPGCNTQVITGCVDCNIGTGNVVVIVNNEINININNCSGGLCGTDPNGVTVIIIIEGCLGVICTPIDVPVVVFNPCLDEEFFQIQPINVPDIHYTLYESSQFTHESFIMIGEQSIIQMCIVIYTFDCPQLNVYIQYDWDLHIIVIYSDNWGLVSTGSFTYTITVTVSGLANNCGTCVACCVSSTGTIVIVSPCVTPIIVVGVVINIDIDYMSPATFNYPPIVTTPSICINEAVFTCVYVSGPYNENLDLCGTSYSAGTLVTVISFDSTTGTFVVDTNDQLEFPTGVYTFEITVTIGTVSSSVTFTLSMHTHCE
jgi:hypothetical protein